MAAVDLHAKLAAAERQLVVQARKCENLIAFFSSQIKSLSEELNAEKSWRSNHMANIFKALLRFESKLKTDQQTIRKQLYEKDTQLNRLHREIVVLRGKYGEKATGEQLNIDAVAQYCPACRKEFHLLETKSVSVQVHSKQCNGQMSNTTNTTDTSSTQSVEYLSSSEEGLAPSFMEARRSKKYMSKRTSGTFRDYLLRSRSSDTKTPSPDIKLQPPKFPESATMDRRRTPSAGKLVSGQLKRASSLCEPSSSYSSYIYDVHGFRPIERTTNDGGGGLAVIGDSVNIPEEELEEDNEDVFEAAERDPKQGTKEQRAESVAAGGTGFESNDDWYASVSDMEDSDSALAKPYGYNAVNPVLECVNQILLQQSMDCTIDAMSSPEVENKAITSTPTLLPSPPSAPPKEPGARPQKRVHFSTQNSMVQVPRTDSYHYVERSSHILSNKMSDKESSPPPLPPPLSRGNHQQQLSYESVYSNEYEPIGSEGTCSVATTNHYVDLEAKHDVILDHHHHHLNFAVGKHPKQPPALPPKPSNLLKIRNVVRTTSFGITSPLSLSGDDLDNETEPDYASILEVNQMPSRRNLHEVFVDVHKSADASSTTTMRSSSNDFNPSDLSADDSFADVPKLPNVAAIISPKKEVVLGSVISQDNYITRSANPSVVQANPKNPKSALPPSILSSTKNRAPPLCPKSKTTPTLVSKPVVTHPTATPPSPAIVCPIPVYEDKLQIQAEFDWYNLDVEYCFKNHNNKTEAHELSADHQLKESDPHRIRLANGGGHKEHNFGVEYNLDEEFNNNNNNHLVLCNGADDRSDHHFGRSISHEETIIEDDRDEDDEDEDEEDDDQLGEDSENAHDEQLPNTVLAPVVLKTNQPAPPLPATPISVSQQCARYRNPFDADNFETFLKETGLTTKPLPRKRKIFY